MNNYNSPISDVTPENYKLSKRRKDIVEDFYINLSIDKKLIERLI